MGRALGRSLAEHDLCLADRATADVTDERVGAFFASVRPDVIVHAAALTDVDQCERDPAAAFRVNGDGTLRVVREAARIGARLVYISTDYVFDGTKRSPYWEEDATAPLNVYGRSKLAGEQRVIEAATGLIVRTSWVYGEGRANFVTNVLEWARSQSELRLVNDKAGSPTSANDLARAVGHLIAVGAAGVYHVSGRGGCTWVEYGREILRLSGLERSIIPISFAELGRPADRPAYTVLSTEKLARTGFTMPHWRDSLREFLLSAAVKR